MPKRQKTVLQNAEKFLVRVTIVRLKTRRKDIVVEKVERLNMPKMDVMAMSEERSIMNV